MRTFDPGQGKSALDMAIENGTVDHLLPLITRIIDLLDTVDALDRQKIIEFLAAHHCYHMGSVGLAETAYAGICKHIGQMAGLRKTSAGRR
jgi:hypothetical protein